MKSSHSFRSHQRGKAPIKLLSLAAVSILLMTVMAPMLFTDSEVSADYQQSVTYYPSQEDYDNRTNGVTIHYSGLAYAAYNPQYDESFKGKAGWEADNVESEGRISLDVKLWTEYRTTHVTVSLTDSITITDVSDKEENWSGVQYVEPSISENGDSLFIEAVGVTGNSFNIWFNFKYSGPSVFAGWQTVNGVSKDPGDILNTDVLIAKWTAPEIYLDIDDHEIHTNDETWNVRPYKTYSYGDNPVPSNIHVNDGSVPKYTDITNVDADLNGDLTSGTYRSIGSQIHTSKIVNNVNLNGHVIIDNLNLYADKQGSNHGDGGIGIFANGYKLIMGTGIGLGGTNLEPTQAPQLYGGTNSYGTISGTDVVIFSGVYYNVIAGSTGDTITGDTRVMLAGGAVLDTLAGGNAGSQDGRITGDAYVYVLGDAFMPGDYYEEKYLGYGNELAERLNGINLDHLVESSILTGGSTQGKVNGNTYVYISNEATLWDVQGGGRRAASTQVGTANVEVSGEALVKHLVCGSITDGNNTSNPTESVKNVKITVKDGASVGSVFGAGYDTYYQASQPSMYDGGTIEVNIQGLCKVGYVYGGGYRGTIGTNSEPIESIEINISGGTVLHDVFGGGRGGVDKILHDKDGVPTKIPWVKEEDNPDYGSSANSMSDTTGHSEVFVNSLSINITGGEVRGNVYGGGESVPTISGSYTLKNGNIISFGGNGGVASTTVTGSISISITGGSVDGSVYGAGKGVETDSSGNVINASDPGILVIKESVDNGTTEWVIDSIPWFKGIKEYEYSQDSQTQGYGDFARVESGSIAINFDGYQKNADSTGADANIFGGGKFGTTHVGSSVQISLNDSTVSGGIYGGGEGRSDDEDVGSLDGSVSITVIGSIIGSHDDTITINDTGFLFGGGKYGKVTGDSISISVRDSTIHGTVFGGGRGHLSTSADYNGDVGSVTGNISISILDGSQIHGDVFGGGEVGTVTNGSIGIRLDSSESQGITGSVFGGGKGDSGDTSVAEVTTGSIDIVVNGTTVSGTYTEHSLFGGGEYALTQADTITVSLGSGTTMYGDVHGGGFGSGTESSIQGATIVNSDRTVIVNGATVFGNVYGGSRLGADGEKGDSWTSEVLLIAGTVMQGTYGGGFQGASHMDSTILVGTPAVERAYELGVAPSMNADGTIGLRINSVYGGGNLDPDAFNSTDGSSVFDQVLLHGNALIRIGSSSTTVGGVNFPGYPSSVPGESPGAVKISIYGDVIGVGNFSDIAGTSAIEFLGYDQNNVYNIRSIQRSDSVTIEDSSIGINGSVDAKSTEYSKLITLNRIGKLILDGSTLDLYYETAYINSYISMADGGYATRADCVVTDGSMSGNRIVLHDGVLIEVTGGYDNLNEGQGKVTGYTLLERPQGDTYYGAFAISNTVDSNVETGFMVDEGKEEASVLMEEGYRFWYIYGYMTLNETMYYASSEWSDTASFNFPQMNEGSEFAYIGSYVSPTVQDGLFIVTADDYSKFDISGESAEVDSGIAERIGIGMYFDISMSGAGGSTTPVTTHVYGSDSFERRFEAASEDGYDMLGDISGGMRLSSSLLSKKYYENGFGTSGNVGVVTIHLAEVIEQGGVKIPVNMIDLRVTLYVDSVPGKDVVTIPVSVMGTYAGTTSDGKRKYKGTGYIDLPLTDGPKYYYFNKMVKGDVGVETLSMWSDMTHLGIGGWNVTYYSDTTGVTLDALTAGSGTIIGQGTGARSATLAFEYSGEAGSFTIWLYDSQYSGEQASQGTVYKVVVTVKEAKDVKVVAAYRPIVYDEAAVGEDWLYLSIKSGEGTQTSPYVLGWVESREEANAVVLQYGMSLATESAWFEELPGHEGVVNVTLSEAMDSMLDRDVQIPDGYTFNYRESLYGWFTAPDYKNKFSMTSGVGEDLSLYAGCGIEVRFHGEGVSLTQTVVYVSPGNTLHNIGYKGLGYNNLEEDNSSRIDLYDTSNVRQGYHLQQFDQGTSWALKGTDGWTAYDFKNKVYEVMDLYLPWVPDEYTMTVEFNDLESSDGVVLELDGTPTEMEWKGTTSATVTIAYGQSVALSLPEGVRITGATYVFGASLLTPNGVGTGSISFMVPYAGDDVENVTLNVQVTDGYTVSIEFYPGKGSEVPSGGVGVSLISNGSVLETSTLYDGQSIRFVVSEDATVLSLAFSIQGYAVAVWSSADGFNDPSERSSSYDIGNPKDITLRVAVYKAVTVQSISNTIASVTGSWEGESYNVTEGSTVYEGDTLTITPSQNYGLPMISSQGVRQIDSTYGFRVTGLDDVTLGDLTPVTVTIKVTVILADDGVTISETGYRFTLTIGPSTYVLIWNGTGVTVDYPTSSMGQVTGSIPGFKDASGTPSGNSVTLTFNLRHYTINYFDLDGNTISNEFWDVTMGEHRPQCGTGQQYTAVGTFPSGSTQQVWEDSTGRFVEKVGLETFGLMTQIRLDAVEPLTKDEVTIETATVTLVSSDLQVSVQVDLFGGEDVSFSAGNGTVTYVDGILTVPAGTISGSGSIVLNSSDGVHVLIIEVLGDLSRAGPVVIG